MAIDFLDGPRFARAIIAGSQWVAAQRVHLNDINVFPVPDGDTGTNLTMTLKAAAHAVNEVRERPLGEVASALSRSVLLGARGNAGIILAQFLRGFAREIQGVDRLYAPGLSRAFSAAVEGAYAAMTNPVEGTVLTVLRATSEAARLRVADGETDLRALLRHMRAAAAESLAGTPELLPVLKDAGVVDAGGEGFVDFLEGVARLVDGDEIGDVLSHVPHPSAAPMAPMKERDLKYRYCTEFIVEGPSVDPADIKVRLVGLGGSLTVIGGNGLARVHIHTNDPDGVMSEAGRLGDLTGTKVDDMRRQHREFIRAHAAPRLGGVRVVTDSTADLPHETAERMNVSVVPLAVCLGLEAYRDGVDITRDEFYSRLDRHTGVPTTTQPSPEVFLGIYEELTRGGHDVLSVHISSGMSGTVASALNAASRTTGGTVRVVDSMLTSAPLGLVVLELARAAEHGAGISELGDMAEDLKRRARVYFTVGSLDYLVRGGRIGRAKALVGKITHMKPLLTITDGRISPVGRAVGDRGVMSRLSEMAEADLDGRKIDTLAVVHAGRPGIVDWAESSLAPRLGCDDVMTFELGCVVGAHAGPGTWGMSYLLPE